MQEAPKRTYGRSQNVGPGEDSYSASMIYDPAVASVSPGKMLVNRWSAMSTDWRTQVASLDADEDQQETTEELQAAMHNLKHAENSKSTGEGAAGLGIRSQLAATSSLTELPSSPSAFPPISLPKGPQNEERECAQTSGGTVVDLETNVDGDVSTSSLSGKCASPSPDHPTEHSMTQPASVDCEEQNDASSDVMALNSQGQAPHSDLSRTLFGDDEIPFMPPPSKSVVKPLRKNEQELLRKDLAAVDRNKEAPVLRTEPPRRPVSQWMANAMAVASVVGNQSKNSAIHPRTSPEDIKQFTPSSGRTRRLGSYSAGPSQLVVPLQPSSPTPQRHDRRSVDGLDDDDEVTLDEALRVARDRSERQARLVAMKKEALLRAAVKQTSSSDDDELSIVSDPVRPELPRPDRFPGRQSKLGGPHPSKNEQIIRRFAGKPAHKPEVLSETHLDFAAGAFDHANLKNVNAGSRPAGQKKYHAQVITHAQAEANLRKRHLEQVRRVSQIKEEKYGKSRALPPKQAADIPLEQVDATQDPSDDSDDDSDFAPDAKADPADEHDQSSQASSENDEDKENQPLPSTGVRNVDKDDEESEEHVRPLRRHRPARRIAEVSDDDEENPQPQRDISLRKAVDLPVASVGCAMPEFEADNDSFSQLFAETQLPGGLEDSDGLAALRDKEPHCLLPAALLLPSVVISESQRKRDNALIAAEFEDANAESVAAKPSKTYLNSEGFFTQSRPADYMTQIAPNSTVTHLGATLAIDESEGSGGSTLIDPVSEGNNVPSPTQQDRASFVRLRRRGSSSSPTDSPQLDVKSPKRNAFDMMTAGARQAARRAELRQAKSALVDEQAEESDEDNGWMFHNKGDDEEDDGDEDGYVPDLVDDTTISEDQQKEQDSLAAEKRRQVEAADDARREAEAKKITEGHYRQKRRGNEFLSDDEDEDGKPRRLSKKQRRQRQLDREDGLFKLGDEANHFVEAYEKDLESDHDYDEAPMSPNGLTSPEQTVSASERREMLRQRARLNRTESSLTDIFPDAEEEQSQFSIARSLRTATDAEDTDEIRPTKLRRIPTATRSIDSYSRYVTDESSNQRRAGGSAAGVSVVVQKSAVTVTKINSRGSEQTGGPTTARGLGRQESGSVLLERAKLFR